MGRMQAESMAEFCAERRHALDWHLRHNHYPPVPLEWLPVCEDLIDALNEGEAWWDDEMDNPVRPGETLTVGEIVSGLHLEPWLRFGEEE